MNRQNRKQYIQRNHHEKIVSRDVFNAANLMKSSRQYSSKSRPLPVREMPLPDLSKRMTPSSCSNESMDRESDG